MTSSSTITTVCSRALLQIGARSTIGDLDEGSTEANACKILYQPTFEMLARSAHWNCLKRQKRLSLRQAALGTPENPTGSILALPAYPWQYGYDEPTDSLQVRYLMPSDPTGASGVSPLTTASVVSGVNSISGRSIPFSVSYSTDNLGNPIKTILTNLARAEVVMTMNQPNPVVWDSLFEQAMVSTLAAFLVPALSLNLALMDISIRGADNLIAQARVRDGNEGVTSQNKNADWMVARRGSGGDVTGEGSSSSYESMSWPFVGG